MSAGKIYEASSLIATSQSRVKNYESLKSQISSLKSAMLKVVNLGDSLQGKGANNIKKFYNEQCSIADQWINLIEAHISF
ncbi:T7SS effector LXG polymorphic toxin, partial [Priestia koreensis]